MFTEIGMLLHMSLVSRDKLGNTVLAIKAVPGASRDEISGALGERLKVRISAPPEDGKANKAVVRLIADALEVSPNEVELVAGASRAEKTLLIRGLSPEEVVRRLGI